jgi:hypothetical protein
MNELKKSVAKLNLIKLIQWTWTLNEENKQGSLGAFIIKGANFFWT